jgi:HD superfamily phosphohydrolase
MTSKQTSSKLIFDSIHGPIRISKIARSIIDTPEFQRLRHIQQLGLCSYVFHCGNHTRFEHSIGVYHLAGLVLDVIHKNNKSLKIEIAELPHIKKINGTLIELIKIAGLCHDIGHGPFSHVFDDLVLHDATHPNKSHEIRSGIIIEKILKRLYPNGEFDDKTIEFIKNVIDPKPEHKGFIYQIVANKLNGFDVDKFDYLERDTRHTGFRLAFDYRRIINEIQIDKNNNICYPKQVVYDVFGMFKIRYDLHKQLYHHKTVKIIEYMLCDIIKLIDPVFKIKQSIEDIDEFCKLTDEVIFNYLTTYEQSLTNKLIKFDIKSKEKIDIKKAIIIMNKINKRQLYSYIGELINKNNIDVDDITKYDNEINKDDIILCKYTIGYVSGNKPNPIEHIYFYDKKETAKNSFTIKKENVSSLIPDNYQEHYTKIFCRHKSSYNKIFDAFCKLKKELNIEDSIVPTPTLD